MPRYKQAERAKVLSETRRRLLEAATQEFARQGYVRANINRISKAAGFAKGTVYNYFDSKRALMIALIKEIAEGHMEFLAGQVRQEADPAKRLERFFEAGFAWVTANRAQARVLITTLNGPDVEFKVFMYEAYRPMFQLVARDILAAGTEQGVFREMEPTETSALLMIIYLGTSSQFDEEGRIYLAPGKVAEFALDALRKRG